MKLIYWMLLPCLLTGNNVRSAPVEKTFVSKAHDNCNYIQDKLFCDFSDTGIEDVYLKPLESDKDINKVFVHNTRNLHLSASFCINVAFQNVDNVLIEDEKSEACEQGYELAAKTTFLKEIPQQLTKIYLELCNITSLTTDSKQLRKLTLLNSEVDIFNITNPFGTNTSLVLQSSRIVNLEKLILETGVDVTVNAVKILTIAPKGLVVNHGNFTFKDSSFDHVLPGEIVILHEDSNIFLESFSGNMYIRKSMVSKVGLRQQETDATKELGNDIVYIVVIACLCIVLVGLLIGAIVIRKSSQADGETIKMTSNIGEKTPFLVSSGQADLSSNADGTRNGSNPNESESVNASSITEEENKKEIKTTDNKIPNTAKDGGQTDRKDHDISSNIQEKISPEARKSQNNLLNTDERTGNQTIQKTASVNSSHNRDVIMSAKQENAEKGKDNKDGTQGSIATQFNWKQNMATNSTEPKSENGKKILKNASPTNPSDTYSENNEKHENIGLQKEGNNSGEVSGMDKHNGHHQSMSLKDMHSLLAKIQTKNPGKIYSLKFLYDKVRVEIHCSNGLAKICDLKTEYDYSKFITENGLQRYLENKASEKGSVPKKDQDKSNNEKQATEQTMTLQEMHNLLQEAKSKYPSKIGIISLKESVISIQKYDQRCVDSNVAIKYEEELRNYLKQVNIQIPREIKATLPNTNAYQRDSSQFQHNNQSDVQSGSATRSSLNKEPASTGLQNTYKEYDFEKPQGLYEKKDGKTFKDDKEIITEQKLTIEEMYDLLQEAKSKNPNKIGEISLRGNTIRTRKYGGYDVNQIKTVQEFQKFLQKVDVQITCENKDILPPDTDNNERSSALRDQIGPQLTRESKNQNSSNNYVNNTGSARSLEVDTGASNDEVMEEPVNKKEIFKIKGETTTEQTMTIQAMHDFLQKVERENPEKIGKINLQKSTIHIKKYNISKGIYVKHTIATIQEFRKFLCKVNIQIPCESEARLADAGGSENAATNGNNTLDAADGSPSTGGERSSYANNNEEMSENEGNKGCEQKMTIQEMHVFLTEARMKHMGKIGTLYLREDTIHIQKGTQYNKHTDDVIKTEEELRNFLQKVSIPFLCKSRDSSTNTGSINETSLQNKTSPQDLSSKDNEDLLQKNSARTDNLSKNSNDDISRANSESSDNGSMAKLKANNSENKLKEVKEIVIGDTANVKEIHDLLHEVKNKNPEMTSDISIKGNKIHIRKCDQFDDFGTDKIDTLQEFQSILQNVGVSIPHENNDTDTANKERGFGQRHLPTTQNNRGDNNGSKYFKPLEKADGKKDEEILMDNMNGKSKQPMAGQKTQLEGDKEHEIKMTIQDMHTFLIEERRKNISKIGIPYLRANALHILKGDSHSTNSDDIITTEEEFRVFLEKVGSEFPSDIKSLTNTGSLNPAEIHRDQMRNAQAGNQNSEPKISCDEMFIILKNIKSSHSRKILSVKEETNAVHVQMVSTVGRKGPYVMRTEDDFIQFFNETDLSIFEKKTKKLKGEVPENIYKILQSKRKSKHVPEECTDNPLNIKQMKELLLEVWKDNTLNIFEIMEDDHKISFKSLHRANAFKQYNLQSENDFIEYFSKSNLKISSSCLRSLKEKNMPDQVLEVLEKRVLAAPVDERVFVQRMSTKEVDEFQEILINERHEAINFDKRKERRDIKSEEELTEFINEIDLVISQSLLDKKLKSIVSRNIYDILNFKQQQYFKKRKIAKLHDILSTFIESNADKISELRIEEDSLYVDSCVTENKIESNRIATEYGLVVFIMNVNLHISLCSLNEIKKDEHETTYNAIKTKWMCEYLDNVKDKNPDKELEVNMLPDGPYIHTSFDKEDQRIDNIESEELLTILKERGFLLPET